MIYSQDVISEVRFLNDIVQIISSYVKLTPRSGNHFGLCPFHNEKTPSFSVNSERQIFYCFGCGAGGDVYRFLQLYEKFDFAEAVQFLAGRVNYNLPAKGLTEKEKQQISDREVAKSLTKRAARFYYDYLDNKNNDSAYAREYLNKRGILAKTRNKFGLGLAPSVWDGLINHLNDVPHEQLVLSGLASKSDKNPSKIYDRFRNRLMFPIIDNRNRVVGFGGRALSDNKDDLKYINTPETALFKKKEILYGLNLAKKSHNGEMIIVEGYMDVIAMHQYGIANAVGVLGTALSKTHARLLKNSGVSTITLLLDNDDAGYRAAMRAIPILYEDGFKIKVLTLKEAKDPDEFLAKFGADMFVKILKEAKSHVTFQVNIALAKYDINTTEGKIGFTGEASKILGMLNSSIEIDVYSKEVAALSGISQSAILQEVNKNMPEKLPNDIILPNKIVAKKQSEKSLHTVKKFLAHLIITHPKAALALEESMLITKEEIEDERFETIFNLAYAAAAEGRSLSAAEIMDATQNEEIQKLVAEIFANDIKYENVKAVERALNDFAKKIKRTHLLAKLEILEDTNLAKPVTEELSKLAETLIVIK